jgi:hypothetical protein
MYAYFQYILTNIIKNLGSAAAGSVSIGARSMAHLSAQKQRFCQIGVGNNSSFRPTICLTVSAQSETITSEGKNMETGSHISFSEGFPG